MSLCCKHSIHVRPAREVRQGLLGVSRQLVGEERRCCTVDSAKGLHGNYYIVRRFLARSSARAAGPAAADGSFGTRPGVGGPVRCNLPVTCQGLTKAV